MKPQRKVAMVIVAASHSRVRRIGKAANRVGAGPAPRLRQQCWLFLALAA